MAKKIVTEVLEIEAGAVLDALRADGWPISSIEKVDVVSTGGQLMEGPGATKFGGLRFTYTREDQVVPTKAGQ